MIKTGLRHCKEFAIDPFLTDECKVDISNVVMKLSRPALELMYYILNKKIFLNEKFVFDIADFKNFYNKKSNTSVIQSLGVLCFYNIIAKTTLSGVYWINRKVFSENKEMEFLENFFRVKGMKEN
ncbi:protein of unknown function (plasmid) [Cardinium endosymbiont cEper1 of Encarsia pergandiella]|uniref:hypothetical protein n=1 Tax=Cardinium endosymbiont of Encarsia pergandiella TaxID=249402 RepID=UPI00027E9E38|nr:hypothetical protein [Cardinium endosymbiont of Encarsia pergandiella]CCM10676.1 protein of unknown function [Cardinium endosymbiont cEper1 of Encarsia pergandiella]